MAFSIAQLQQIIQATYDAKDRRRGVEGTFMWLMEEVGELATALRSGTPREQAEAVGWHVCQRGLRKAPQNPVHFLGTAMARAIGGAPAACFDVVGHEDRL